MTKREIVIGVSGFATAVVLAGSGYLLFVHKPAKAPQRQAQQTVGDHVIPLGQKSASTKPGGLSVSSATNLGQLNNRGSSENTGSPSNNGLDPATFKQYDKYKDSQSGLFAEIEKGSGVELTIGRTGAVLYKGWLTDGTLFDQSRTGSDGKLQALSFRLGDHQVIAGWEQAMAGMKAGGTRLLIIPPAVGYGAQGQGPIPGNAVLVFLAQLVDVQ